MHSVVDDLALLAQVIEAGGFTSASRRNGITKSRLSRRVAELESRLGVRLIDRTSRSFRVTELGLRLYAHGASIRAAGDAALTTAQESMERPQGPLRVACPVVLAELVIGRIAACFAAQNPDVKLTFDVTSGLPDAPIEQYDLMLRAAPDGLRDSAMIARQLMVTPYELVATRAWLAAAGKLRAPKDLAGRDGIGWWQVGDAPRWRLRDAAGEEQEITIKPRFITNNLAVARTAALAGLGMARLPRPLCAADLTAGRLRRVLAGFAPPSMGIYAAYPSRRSLTLAGRLFLEQLERGVQTWLGSAEARGRR
jgi:DNA-binding transcriptional LysR family regulator